VAVAVYALKAELDRLAVTADLHSDYQLAREAFAARACWHYVFHRLQGWSGSQVRNYCCQPNLRSRCRYRAIATAALRLYRHHSLPFSGCTKGAVSGCAEGERIANAASERGGKHSADFATTLVPEGDVYRINGRKYYATGSIGARWVTVIGKADHGGQALGIYPHRLSWCHAA
jgi:hypothetical protein